MSLRTRFLAATLVAVVLAVPFAASAADDPRVLVIRGRITDAENWPIGDVKVSAIGSRRASTTTDASGQYELEIPLGMPADLARRPFVLRVTARLRGWRTSLPEGAEALGLEMRAASGEGGAVGCEIRSNHARVTSAAARALLAASEGRGTAQVNFLAERGAPSAETAELDLFSSERVTLAGVQLPRPEARAEPRRAQATAERRPAEGEDAQAKKPASQPAPGSTGRTASESRKTAEKPVEKPVEKPAEKPVEKPAPPAVVDRRVAKTPPPQTPADRRPASSMSLPMSAEERAEAEAAAKLERENRRALAEARKRERHAVEAEAKRQRDETRSREKLEKIARADAEALEREEAKRRRSEARAAEEELREERGMQDTRWNALRREVHLIAGAADTATAPPVTVLEDIAGAPPKAGSRGRPPSRRAMIAFRDTVPVRPVRHAPEPAAETPPSSPPPRAVAARPAPSPPPRSASASTAPSRGTQPARAPADDRVAATVRAPGRTATTTAQDPTPRPTTGPRGGNGEATMPGVATPAESGERSPRIVPTPDGEGRARARPILIRAPGPGSASEDTSAGTCRCRIEGTVEVQSERPLPARARVAVSLVWYPALADTVELFMGSPRAFRLPPAPCGPQRLKVTSLGQARFDVVSRDAMAGFRCTAGSLHQHRLVLAPR